MRKRTTWNKSTGRQAATNRRADIYEMNQDHSQPSATDYESGDPDAWAESWHGSESRVDAEYEGGAVKRNSLGFPEFRDDTWKHKSEDKWGRDSKGKYDNHTSSERKASAVEAISRALLKTANDKAVEDQTVDLMSLPNQIIVSTLKRMKETSPKALEPQARYNRAMACAKLGSRMLGEAATEKGTEAVARAIYAADDVTLKGIISAVAAAHTADDETQTAPSVEPPKAKEGTPPAPEVAPAAPAPEDITENEAEMVERMLAEELQALNPDNPAPEAAPAPVAEVPAAPAAPAAPGTPLDAPPAPVDELEALFNNDTPSEEAPAAPEASADPIVDAAPAPEATPVVEVPAAPSMDIPAIPLAAASQTAAPGLDISFGDDDSGSEEISGQASQAELDSLFSDNEEVQAARELNATQAAQAPQAAQAAQGPFTAPAGRTASSNPAKKLGQVKPGGKEKIDTILQGIWGSPED